MIRIEYMSLFELKAAPRNPKNHDLDGIGESFARFGYIDPMVVDERTGALVAGHGRLDKLSRMFVDDETAPEHIQVTESGAWLVPVVRGAGFADEGEAEAYLIATNRLVEAGGWDDAALADALRDLDDLDGTGFDEAEVADVVRKAAEESSGTFDDDSGNNTDADNSPTSDNSDADITVKIGRHVFFVPRDAYLTWDSELRSVAGSDDASIEAEISHRLGFHEVGS